MERKITPEIANRFWSKVIIAGRNECWIWLAAMHARSHYGQFKLYGKMEEAHRVAYWLANNDWPGKLKILHSCDNPLCENPNHLRKGTIAENNRDRDMKGRRVDLRGEQHAHAKLKWKDVEAIRASKEKGKILSARYGVSQSEISLIRNYKLWTRRY